MSVLPDPNNDPPPREVDPVMVPVVEEAASVAGFVSATAGFTSAAGVIVAAAVVPREAVADPELNSEVPVERPPVGAVAVVFSGVVVDEKKDVIPGCLLPPRPFAAGAAVVPLVLPRLLVRLGKLLVLGKEELAADVPKDKLVLTFGFVVAGLELPDEKEKPLVAAGVVVAAGCVAADKPKDGAAVTVVVEVEVNDGSPDVIPVPVLAGELKEKVGLIMEPAVPD